MSDSDQDRTRTHRMLDYDLAQDPRLEERLLTTLRTMLSEVYPTISLSKLFASDPQLTDRLARKLFNYHNCVVSEIPIPLSKVAYIRRAHLAPNLGKERLIELEHLEHAYETRLVAEDGRHRHNVPAPYNWTVSALRLWVSLLQRLNVDPLTLSDLDGAVRFINLATETVAYSEGSEWAALHAWLIVNAIDRESKYFPRSERYRSMLQIYACGKGVYHSFVVEDLRRLIYFRNFLKRKQSIQPDTLASISYNMSFYYEDRILNSTYSSSLNGSSPCSDAIELYIQQAPILYARFGWDHHSYYRHLIDESLSQGAYMDDRLPFEGTRSLEKAARDAIKISEDNSCNECNVGSRLTLGECFLRSDQLSEALAEAELALCLSAKNRTVSLKTRARTLHLVGTIKNCIKSEDGDRYLIDALNSYQALRARFSAERVSNDLSHPSRVA